MSPSSTSVLHLTLRVSVQVLVGHVPNCFLAPNSLQDSVPPLSLWQMVEGVKSQENHFQHVYPLQYSERRNKTKMQIQFIYSYYIKNVFDNKPSTVSSTLHSYTSTDSQSTDSSWLNLYFIIVEQMWINMWYLPIVGKVYGRAGRYG